MTPEDPKAGTGPASPERPLPRAFDLLGWYGTAAILVAYLLSSHGHLEQGLFYQVLNLTGALAVGLVCWLRRTWQALALEVAWAIVSLSALIRLLSGS